MKIIFVTGWVISGLGKGITAASIGRLLKSAGKSVSMIKMDPYLQVDAGTMSPYEHWEVFVTDDGWETDLDIWNYERFTWESFIKSNNITTGQVYQKVISNERDWKYLWKTVQIIPHITDEIKSRIINSSKWYDVTIVEVGWTVWDIESLPFLEAIRQFRWDIWKENVLYVHVAPLIHLSFSWEIKTKPIQHSVSKLRSYWIHPNILVCRTDLPMEEKVKEKISLLCDLDLENIIEAKNASSIYQVPELFRNQNLDKIIISSLNLGKKRANLASWNKKVDKIINPKKTKKIAIVGKYSEFKDTYMSISESIVHAWAKNNIKIEIEWISSEDLENKYYTEKLESLFEKQKISWVIVPGGFGERWVEWKINAITYLRENKIPFLWICLGLQLAVIEFARNVCDIKDANSSEFSKSSKNMIVDIMENQKNIKQKWWTMRLWAYDAKILKDSKVYDLYKNEIVSERHRHRYEVNPAYHDKLRFTWLIISATSPDWKLVEFIELKNHPFFIATQAHPEFKSNLEKSHPLFDWFVRSLK